MSDDPPPLKTDPKYGYFPWWPEDGNAWIHPEDIELARSMIPSLRVWCREGKVGRFAVLHYGKIRLRVLPRLWREVTFEGLSIGDLVEVLPRGMQAPPETGRIREILWNAHARAIRYQLELTDGGTLDREFEVGELKIVEPPKPIEQARLEPLGEDSPPLNATNEFS